jgi:hypothetical protein
MLSACQSMKLTAEYVPCVHLAQPYSTILVSPGFRLPFFGCQFPDEAETGKSNLFCTARAGSRILLLGRRCPDGAGGYGGPSHTCAGVSSSVAAAFVRRRYQLLLQVFILSWLVCEYSTVLAYILLANCPLHYQL